MIIPWLGYWLALSALIGIAAAAIDRTRRLAHRSSRWVWALAIVACLVAPMLARAAQRARLWIFAAEPVAGLVVAARSAAPTADVVGPRRAMVRVRASASHGVADTMLLLVWLFASAVLGARLVLAMHRVRRMRGVWRASAMDGQAVLVSRDVGPAVAGFVHPAIVIPEWVLEAAPRDQRLILLHEREHLRAGDPIVLLAARAAVALMPWNVVAWWLAHRLRLAVELDCDARVLRDIPDVSAYGALLIEVGRRASSRRVVPLAALSDPPTFLERRISMLTTRRPRHTVLSAIAVVALTAIPAAAATVVPHPAVVRPTLAVSWHAHGARSDSISSEALQAMKVSMRNFMVAQEAYFSDNGKYAPSVESMGDARYKPEAGVTARLTWAGDNAYVLEVTDALAPGATCIVHVGWIPRTVWPATALEKKTAAEGRIVCDGDGIPSHAAWQFDVKNFMTVQLQDLILTQERARGATGTYPGDASKIAGNSFDPALHFTYLWADTASWAVKAVYDSIPGKSCVAWAGSRAWSNTHPRIYARTVAQRRFPGRGEVACDDF